MDNFWIALMMKAASTSETPANFYEATWRYNPEYSHSHTLHRENIKPYFKKQCLNKNYQNESCEQFSKFWPRQVQHNK
jgi:hypothetical protein